MKKACGWIALVSVSVLSCFLAGRGPAIAEDSVKFMRGDSNSDGFISISDALMTRRFLFNGALAPQCYDTADVDDDQIINIVDVVRTLEYVFTGLPAIAAPYPELGLDPTDDLLSCESYEVVPPAETDDLIRLGEVEGAPGDHVEIPVFLTNTVDVEAFQLIVSYDPTIFTPDFSTDLPTENALILDGTFYEGFQSDQVPWFTAVTSVGDPSEGIFKVGFVPHHRKTEYAVPPGEDWLVFKIGGQISETAPVGTGIRLEPTNGPGGGGVGELKLRNELTHRGEARYASILPRTQGAILRVVPDVTIFVRGNANDDAFVDISDAVYILGYLFTGGAAPRCLDAADANDSGYVDISDAVAILMTLFLGQSSIAPPYPLEGRDTTADDLGDCGT